MKVTKNPSEKFTENCLTHFVFASVTFTEGGMRESGGEVMYVQENKKLYRNLANDELLTSLSRANLADVPTTCSVFRTRVRSLLLAGTVSLHLGSGLFLMLQIKTRDALLGEPPPPASHPTSPRAKQGPRLWAALAHTVARQRKGFQRSVHPEI